MDIAPSDIVTSTGLRVLLALALKPRHGYELIRQISLDSQDRIRLGPGTLYAAIKKLRNENYIEEIPVSDHSRKRVYRLTKKGWDCLAAEIYSLEQLVALAKERQAV